MKNGMRRMICVVLAVMMLPFFVACGEKKDQVVHVGETVQYGDFEFTFLQQEIEVYEGKLIVRLNIDCGFKGDGTASIFSHDFHVYADGEGLEMDDSFSDRVHVSNGRTSDLSVTTTVPIDSKTVEFDYSNSYYSKQWGKITFVVDIPQDYQPEDDWVLGNWTDRSKDTDWIKYNDESKFVFGRGRTGAYSYEDYDNPEKNDSKSFTYRYLDDRYILVSFDDDTNILMFHSEYTYFGERTETLEYSGGRSLTRE